MGQGKVLANLERHEEAAAAWERTTEYVHAEDPTELRYVAIKSLYCEAAILIALERYEDVTAILRRIPEYVRPNDSTKQCHLVARMLTLGSKFSNLFGKHDEAEAGCRKAIDIAPTYDEGWCALATAILDQNDDVRLPEAEECARRAVELGPKNPSAFQTLSDVLACRGQWTEALDQLENALSIGG